MTYRSRQSSYVRTTKSSTETPATLALEKREEIVSDTHLSGIDYRINRRPSSLQKVSGNSVDWDRII